MFCIWLKKTREALGLTQQELGRAAGLSASTISMYEQGRRRPSPPAAARLKACLAAGNSEMPPLPTEPERARRERFREEVRRAAEKG